MCFEYKPFNKRIIVLFIYTIYYLCTYNSALAVASFLTSLPLIGEISSAFSNKGEIELEEVMLSINDDMNEKGAVKLHIIIIFEKELLGELKRMSSREYFRNVEQLTKDNPDKIKVFQWELVAKKRITKWIKVPYESDFMTPVGGIIFANYNTIGEHRALIPTACKKLKITLEKDDFKVQQADQPTSSPSTTNKSPPFPTKLTSNMPSEDIIPKQLNNELPN